MSLRHRSITPQRKRRVQYVPTIVTQAELRRAIANSGFEALELGGEAEDAEAQAREREINEQRRLLIIGLIFTIPLFLLSMGKDLVCSPMSSTPITPGKDAQCTGLV